MLKLKITHEDLSQMMLLSSSVQSVTQTLATATAAGAKDREKEGVKAAQQRVSEQDGSKEWRERLTRPSHVQHTMPGVENMSSIEAARQRKGDGRGGGGPEVDWTTPEWLEYERRSLLLLQLAFLLHLDRFWLRHTRLRVIVLTPDKDSTTLILRLRQVMRDARIYADVVAVSL